MEKFQFHKGTIRTDFTHQLSVSHYNFNSIKVQLELIELITQILLKLLFQFHKGTIRTIKAKNFMQRPLYFNSIKVQLEPSII